MAANKELIGVLGRLGNVEVIDGAAARPAGCVMTLIQKQHNLLIEVKGLIDINKEVGAGE